MAIKKSELYSSLWASCDELRGGMDASQYKDYVLVLLFVKYVSDKYAGVPYAPITIPEGASFKDMVALKGKSDIGDQINKKIIGPLANANKLSDMPDFNDPGKLGNGQEIVDRLTNLISIFENKSLDFSKNRARDCDIHKIVDVFNRRDDSDPKYARTVGIEEIEKNDFNLNIPRYIDSQQAEDIQDIEGHLKGGIPSRDVDALDAYWQVCPQLRQAIFSPRPQGEGPGVRVGYVDLATPKPAIKSTIYEHPEFVAYIADMNGHFAAWRQRVTQTLKNLQPGCHPKAVIHDLLAHYAGKPLIDRYAVFQHLMDYWSATMQDDCYLIAADGGEEGLFSELDKVNKASVTARLKEIKGQIDTDSEAKDEATALNSWLKLCTQEVDLKKAMSSIQSNCGEFAAIKTIEFEGIETQCRMNPVEFDRVGRQGGARA